MISPQGYSYGKKPQSVNPFWDETSTADTHYAQATGKKLQKEKEAYTPVL